MSETLRPAPTPDPPARLAVVWPEDAGPVAPNPFAIWPSPAWVAAYASGAEPKS